MFNHLFYLSEMYLSSQKAGGQTKKKDSHTPVVYLKSPALAMKMKLNCN